MTVNRYLVHHYTLPLINRVVMCQHIISKPKQEDNRIIFLFMLLSVRVLYLFSY